MTDSIRKKIRIDIENTCIAVQGCRFVNAVSIFYWFCFWLCLNHDGLCDLYEMSYDDGLLCIILTLEFERKKEIEERFQN